MQIISKDQIKDQIADSQLIFYRGLNTFHHGSYFLSQKDMLQKRFVYEFDGTFGNYTVQIHLNGDQVESACDCPYPQNRVPPCGSGPAQCPGDPCPV